MAARTLVNDLLRSSDELKAVLEATYVVPGAGTAETQDARNSIKNRRVLAVVSHKDEWDMTEEGSLFICKYRSPVAGHPEELDIHRVLPIYGRFSLVMGQVRRDTLDLSATSSKVVLDQPRSVLTVTITPAEGANAGEELPTFITNDLQTLKVVVSECKRLNDLSDIEDKAIINLAQSKLHFSWLRPYIMNRTTIDALLSSPPDLRQVIVPLQDRLSPVSAGLMGDDHQDIQIFRDEYIRRTARERTRKGRRRLKIRLGTFNVNGKMPSQDLSAWIQGAREPPPHADSSSNGREPLQSSPPGMFGNPFDWLSWKPRSHHSTPESENVSEPPPSRVDNEDEEDPDMLVLGFQELDLSTEALLYSTSTVREDAWCLAIFAALGEKAVKYEKLSSKQLVGMLIVIIVKKSLKDCFKDVAVAMAGAGILGVMGNKGAVAIRVSFVPPDSGDKLSVLSPGPTTITFVNAHLAAFDEMVDKRNLDFHDISKRLVFENTFTPAVDASEEGKEAEDAQTPLPWLSVYDCDALFWLVCDLNYRVDIPDIEMRRYLRDEEWDNASKFQALARYDQLNKAIKDKKAFDGFQEMSITHMPTYRFSPGLAMDKLGYDLKRKPAWTDRVLYMHGPACSLLPLLYTAHPQITMSDHRPVAADFELDIDYYDIHSRHTVMRRIFHEMEGLDAESMGERGGLQVSETFVDFDKVFYNKPIEKKIKIKNASKMPSAFRFVPVQPDAPIHPEWLQVHPLIGVLLPDEAVEVSLRIHVDARNAENLNLHAKDIGGTLILHTVLGKDHFISVAGEYQYTCFANKLTRLTRLKGPIKSLKSANDLLPEDHPVNAPREVMRLVNWLMSNPVDSDDLFIIPGKPDIVASIRECLDTGDEFPFPSSPTDPSIARSFATALVEFLNALPEPLIPANLHSRSLEMTNRDEAFELLDSVPPAAVNVWISITAFLHFICQTSKQDDKAMQLANALTPVLLRDDPNYSGLPTSPAGKRKFLLFFISES
ncbi:DNase I-like protein [Panaeolus papilionaceus]|nr:DNase I-like protein [Panaeolus papilionaceus]